MIINTVDKDEGGVNKMKMLLVAHIHRRLVWSYIMELFKDFI